MVQIWRLYNIDLRERISFDGGRDDIPGWFFGADPTRLLNVLRRQHTVYAWEGHRIICLGDGATVDDLPRGLFSEDDLVSLGFKDQVDEIEEGLNVQCVLNEKFRRVRPTDDGVRDHSEYILRNFSKKVYVRGPMLAKGGRKFGQMLFPRICWSSSTSTGITQPDNIQEITRGSWAGDRFDIVDVDDVEDILVSEEWEDVTEELTKEVEAIFSANEQHVEDSFSYWVNNSVLARRSIRYRTRDE